MKKYSNNQSGRSMIEMLGVLAIVGVLSVAGIAGYSKAMGKYKINKAMDQVATLAANIKTMFASTGTYAGLTPTTAGAKKNERAYKLGLFPEEMVKTCTATFADSCVVNALNGAVEVAGATSNFTIKFSGLTRDACTALASSDWGGSSGFDGLTAKKSGGTATAITSFALAAANCSDASEIVWTFH